MSTQLINRTERLAAIEKLLFQSAAGLRVVEIAEACGVDRRTIYRDLALLKEVGVPIYQQEGRYRLKHEHYAASLKLNINELIALYIALRGLEYYLEHQNPHVISVLKKVARSLPEPVGVHIEYMIETIGSNPVDRAYITVLDTLTRAWAEQRKVKLWYMVSGSPAVTAREFAIYFLEPSTSGELYAVGYDYLSHYVGAVELNRIKRVQLLNHTYEVPSQLDRRRYLATALGTIRDRIQEKSVDIVLSFSPDVAPLIKEKLRYSGNGANMANDDRYVISLQVADWHELLPWIRSWGTKVEVLEPRALRDILAHEATKLAAVYSNPGAALT